jgi:hypothetical protein
MEQQKNPLSPARRSLKRACCHIEKQESRLSPAFLFAAVER